VAYVHHVRKKWYLYTSVRKFAKCKTNFQLTKRTAWVFQETVEELLYCKVKVAGTCDWVGAYQTALV